MSAPASRRQQMKSLKAVLAIVLAILLAACVSVYFATRESDRTEAQQNSTGEAKPLVDTSLLQTAVSLASSAATPDEQANAREAWRLADHELDLTFAAALRQAGAEAESAKPGNSVARWLTDRIAALKARVEADKKRVAALGPDASDALDLARAQLDLDQDELDDAQQDRARVGGDKRARLQRLLQEHEASDKVADQTIKFGSPAPTGTMSEQIQVWLSLRNYARQLNEAGRQAAVHARDLLAHHEELEHRVSGEPDTAASVDRLRELSAEHKTLAGLDQRIEDTKQLATLYQRWNNLVEHRRRGVSGLLLQSLAVILSILLATLLLNGAADLAFHHADRRRQHQLRVIARTALQLTAVIFILLVLFGPPTQLSTMIGLVTAGLTVVMKDFIVAFFGWFTLMGKNGVSVGDWVEIEGVSGEVIEIGILKTVLLELGNWTATGLPTGRRVAFSNSFAMERHYFNFSTSGQWLWDELRITVPPSADPYETAQRIRDIVDRETKTDAAEAGREWERVTRQYGAREFSAAPAVDLRPGGSGLELIVRYITRAPQRNIVQAKLFQAIINLLREPESAQLKQRSSA